jgi:hypothetical protein
MEGGNEESSQNLKTRDRLEPDISKPAVANIRADLYEFQPTFNYETFDLHITTEYVSSNQYNIVVRRLDLPEGWGIPVKVLVFYENTQTHEVYEVGRCDDFAEKRHRVTVNFPIFAKETQASSSPAPYKMINGPPIVYISRQDFNRTFDTDFVVLPAQLYAVGIKNAQTFIYNEKFILFHEIIRSINHIISVYLTYRDASKPFYFVICAGDGYMEYHYPSERTVPRQISETECANQDVIKMQDPKEYAVFNSKMPYILAQSYQTGTPNAMGIPDRHYFYCNLYQSFRSFHRGMPFATKIAKVAYVARVSRGTTYNYTTRRDITLNQREYFFSEAVNKKNVDCSMHWVFNRDLVKYKYILDIDGMASTWDATAWKMNSGSVLFKTDTGWRQWFYDDFLPWVHYIPVRDDFSDLDEKFEWCENHQPECEQIIKNSIDLFEKTYRFQNVVDYTLGVIDKILEVAEYSGNS